MLIVASDPPPPPPAVEEPAAAVLDRRLSATSLRPLAVALSGGGDSVALLLIAAAWAKRQGRPLVALTVDHQLSPHSRGWTAACADRARRLGVGFEALAWTGPKPASGLPAAARAARHRLLAEAARRAGARALLLGHTADDVLEARAMREAGSTTPEPHEWAPSPAWPEGRGLFLLRPLLGLRRARLRDWLAARGENWIEDPANADVRFARARARAALADAAEVAPAASTVLSLAGVQATPWGGLVLDRAAFRAVPPAEARRLLGLACVCAGGGSRLPAAAARDRLAARLRAQGPVAASLAGARVEGGEREIRILREAGEAARGGLAAIDLAPGLPAVWDGRFEITAAQGGGVQALRGRSGQLPKDQRRALAAVPVAARPGLPLLVDAAGAVNCPLLAAAAPAAVVPLVEARLRAAAGLVAREPDED